MSFIRYFRGVPLLASVVAAVPEPLAARLAALADKTLAGERLQELVALSAWLDVIVTVLQGGDSHLPGIV